MMEHPSRLLWQRLEMKTKQLASTLGLALAGVAVISLAAALVARRNFLRHIKHLKRSLENSRAATGVCVNLPPEVIALARRLGVSPAATGRIVRLTQRGEMFFHPGAKPVSFSAEQIIAVSEVGFLWHAHFAGKCGLMQVIDYVTCGEAGLEAVLLGMVPLVQLRNTDSAFRGEAMRYLAELIWNPDALLSNGQLVWRVIDEQTLAVGTGQLTRWSEVRLLLNEAGDVIEIQAEDRPRQVGQGTLNTAWFGRASDYQTIGGRRLPTQAEVGWVLEDEEFIYWRSCLASWSMDV